MPVIQQRNPPQFFFFYLMMSGLEHHRHMSGGVPVVSIQSALGSSVYSQKYPRTHQDHDHSHADSNCREESDAGVKDKVVVLRKKGRGGRWGSRVVTPNPTRGRPSSPDSILDP